MAVMTMTTTIKKPETLSVRDLLADPDLTHDDLKLLFDLSERVKATPGEYAHALRGKQLAMIFEKPSLRTRTTFEVGITSLGGFAVYLEHTKPRLGEREAIKDIARNLDRWVHGIVARTFAHESVLELAANASIPVINALTDLYHPCQALADYFTLHEKFGDLKGLKLAFRRRRQQRVPFADDSGRKAGSVGSRRDAAGLRAQTGGAGNGARLRGRDRLDHRGFPRSSRSCGGGARGLY